MTAIIFQKIIVDGNFGMSILGGLIFTLVFGSGWLFGESLLKKSINYLLLSLTGVLVILFEYFFVMPNSILIEHAIIFGIGTSVTFVGLLFKKVGK